ncbi:hypothetical protein G3563_29995, partial [Escherichia coli]|nr:hypothetical protein [Escherichia coli]
SLASKAGQFALNFIPAGKLAKPVARVGVKIAEQQLKAISDGNLAGAISVFKPQNLLRTTITANLFKIKTEEFNLKGIAK